MLTVLFLCVSTDQLEATKKQKTQFLFYRYVTAYLACLYGHRCGVFQNLTIKELLKASCTSGTYLINVDAHKTNQAFGPAQMSLTLEEYRWFRRFLDMKDELDSGPEAKYVFFTSTPNRCKNLNYFQLAWSELGLLGSPTFTDIRSSIAMHASNTKGVDERYKIAKFMCHNTCTADKFYAANLTVKKAWEHCQLFQQVLEMPGEPEAEGRLPFT